MTCVTTTMSLVASAPNVLSVPRVRLKKIRQKANHEHYRRERSLHFKWAQFEGTPEQVELELQDRWTALDI